MHLIVLFPASFRTPCGLELAGTPVNVTSASWWKQRGGGHQRKLAVMSVLICVFHNQMKRSDTLTTVDSCLWTSKRKVSDKGNIASKNPMGRINSILIVPFMAHHRLEMLLQTRRKEPWAHFREICLLLPQSLHYHTEITPHTQSTDRLERNILSGMFPPFACNKIKILPTKCAWCVLINHENTGFFHAFSFEHFTPFHLQRARVVVKP